MDEPRTTGGHADVYRFLAVAFAPAVLGALLGFLGARWLADEPGLPWVAGMVLFGLGLLLGVLLAVRAAGGRAPRGDPPAGP